MKKRCVIILIICFIMLIMLWMSSFIKCEILTARYKNEFIGQYKQTNMISNVDYFKILKYTDDVATVYYVSKNSAGNVVFFTKENGLWVMKQWETVWSKTGSADGFIWPYIR